jgi:UDP-glucose 4-epimerase
MKVLVTGGAGYIGSHVVKALREAGHETLILDNFSTGHGKLVQGECIEGDLNDLSALDRVFMWGPEAVIHMAASCIVSSSMRTPFIYYRNNVSGMLNLLCKMLRHQVYKIVFSSSAAVYGNRNTETITEYMATEPESVYGFTKLVGEKMLRDGSAYGLKSVSLRYFNAAGASRDASIGEWHEAETHLIPLAIFAALGRAPQLEIYGDDYPTRDGTCVRDYIHVEDLAYAHMRALERMDGDVVGAQVYNLGIGQGFTVREVLTAVSRVSGFPVPFRISYRRTGDPAELVANAEKARQKLGWSPKYTTLEAIIETALKWHAK